MSEDFKCYQENIFFIILREIKYVAWVPFPWVQQFISKGDLYQNINFLWKLRIF